MSSARVPYGGIATRAVALAVDIALAQLLVLVGTAIFAAVASLVGEVRPQWLVGLILAVAWIVAMGCYLILFWSTTGQTPGMRLMRLRVVGPHDQPPRPLRATVRFVGLLLAIVPLFLGFLPVLFDDRRRGIHDMLAGTVVLYVDVAEESQVSSPAAPSIASNSP